MNRSKWIKALGIALLLTVLTGGYAGAGGLSLYEFGSPEVGLAAAGWAARAQDAATVFTNPAGMSRLDRTQFLGSMQALYGNVEFDASGETTYVGGDGGNAVGWMPGGSFFFAQKINPKFSVGLGVLSYFGLGLDYDDDWAGRYFIQEGTLIGMTLTPAVSYRVNDWLSVGVGLNAMYGILDNKLAIKNPLGSDGKLKYEDEDWGYGWTIGILLEPKPGTRIGLSYLSEVDLDFSDTTKISGLGPALTQLLTRKLDMSFTVPQMVMFSVYHELNPQWSIMGNLGWQDWSEFGQIFIEVDNPDAPTRSKAIDANYDDTWHLALGAQYRYSPSWTFTGGIAYDSSAVDDDHRSVTVPMGEAWRFALGGQYVVNPNVTVGGAYELAWTGDMPVDQRRGPTARLEGEFEDTYFHFFALNLTWKF
ncbi:MAG: transporter [Syntrophaceae bacterium]|nr:transporter [Syntrophaceae bacterium]